MAPIVAEYIQSDYLYLMTLKDGRLIGFSAEFEYGTYDIREATDCENIRVSASSNRNTVIWFGISAEMAEGWTPATLTEIKASQLEKCLIGWKADMKVAGSVNPLEWNADGTLA
jgi:hypothetical protein